MDFKQIEAFINVAKFKSFSKAANFSFLSQPAISSHISILEKELKVYLFDRTPKEVHLTPAGESFLNFALELLEIRDNAIYTLTNFNETITGNLKLASSTTPCNTLVPSLIEKFHNIHPSVTFDVLELNSSKIIDNIIKFNFEIGLIGEPIDDEKIESYELTKDELVIISHPSFNFPDIIDMPSLFKYNFILREKGSATRKTFEDALTKNGYSISHITSSLEVNNISTLIQFVRKGFGIAVVSKEVLKNYVSLGLVKESTIKNIPLTRSIYLIISSKISLTPTAKSFFNFCKKCFKID
ncbi:selenium metabolism-associated LysR family transcriptional regulator [Clostridium ljungdahlii]|uniref:selenium metabolism-associated LysR family transcriptional regulator n=1 Tax=Clostridium ljungdahlii TaxID=1538 RepID=UPI00386EBB58